MEKNEETIKVSSTHSVISKIDLSQTIKDGITDIEEKTESLQEKLKEEEETIEILRKQLKEEQEFRDKMMYFFENTTVLVPYDSPTLQGYGRPVSLKTLFLP